MNKKTENKAKRDAKIYAEFSKMRDKKKHGVAVYAFAYIVGELAEKYFLEATTIENIITEQKKKQTINNNE